MAYSPSTRDWLRCQTHVNRWLAEIVNGRSRFARRYPGDWIYRYVYPDACLWRGSTRIEPEGVYSQQLKRLLQRRWFKLADLYQVLNEAASFLSVCPPDIETRPVHVTARQMASVPPGRRLTRRIQEMVSPLENSVSVYLHGSMATQDDTPFSDVDDLVIIHSQSWQSLSSLRRTVQALERAAVFFQRVDPLQHHGHWVFSDYDLVCLDQSVMPLKVLEHAVLLTGHAALSASVRQHTAELRRILWYNLQTIRQAATKLDRDTLNLYELKHLVSSISLVPALVFQVRGEQIDKRAAIDAHQRILSEAASPAITWATHIREMWHTCPGFGWVERMKTINRILPFRRDVLERIARNHSPAVGSQSVPFLNDGVMSAIFRMTDECADQLIHVIGTEP